MRIAHIITGLGNGGAELSLNKICNYDKLNEHHIISLTDLGKYGHLLKKKKFKVYCLEIKKNFFILSKFFKLISLLKKIKPDLIQTWMFHSDFLGSLATLFYKKKIIWNIRNSNVGNSNRLTYLIIKLLSLFSWFFPEKIIICSKYSIKNYEKLGYCKNKFLYIPNGYDLSYLKPIIKINKIRSKYNISKSIPLIGTVARFHPQKDHENLIKALYFLKKNNVKFLCVLVGFKIDHTNKYLMQIIKKYQMSKQIKLYGESKKIREIMSELDIHILPSAYGEGFPNVVAESMACMTPSVVTDVGDSKFIVGKNGWVARPSNSLDLSKKINKALNELKKTTWKRKCTNARSHIKINFSIKKMLYSYNQLWRTILVAK